MHAKEEHSRFSVDELLASGGDARIACDGYGVNRYGCHSVPQPGVLGYSSSTASTISPTGHAACERLLCRLDDAGLREAPSVTYAGEMDRIRHELISLLGLVAVDGLEIAFGGSGTDLHLFASHLLRTSASHQVVIMPEASETGSGMRAALEVGGVGATEVITVAGRFESGVPQPKAVVDAEVEARVRQAVSSGGKVLLILTDVSKTGLIIPSPACALAMRERFPAQVDVMVDACQFRLANSTIRSYLEHGFLVAMTGSKFVTGPAFCGALLIPPGMAERMRGRSLPSSAPLSGGERWGVVNSCPGDWPNGWSARSTLADNVNYGLLLRFEAALAEMKAFHLLPEARILNFAETFAAAIRNRLAQDRAFEPLIHEEMDRQPFACDMGWDHVPTIFPFLLRGRGSTETVRIYEMMREDRSRHACTPKPMQEIASRRCLLGQPVAGGIRDGVSISALRINLDMRLIVDALSPNGRGGGTVIAEALLTLDKAALLARYPVG